LIRIIIYAAIAILVFFAYRFFKLLTSYKSGSRPNVSDLKDRAEQLKNKYKNVEEADFRDITSSDDESETSKR
jgi:hypothetical protein